MAYLVLARKYRPQCFEDVVKQDHITKALANAIVSGRLAHAILLCGPRGTGKTTIARILAKCVNCETGPTAVPCNACRSCREITAGHGADVFEIDGASNNKVDNIREIRENAHYLPAHSPYKIYIIDEVHMLSDSAFNALLKILEEPPAHVKFFFATTEPNKLPITILSRCQRHDCRRVAIDAIIAHLAGICQKESIEISREGLTVIARQADGSIRDALSLLDLIITSAAGPIHTEQILDVLGGLDRQDLFEISQAVFERDAGRIIGIIDRLYDRGQHMVKFFSEVLEHFRNLLVVKMGGGERALANVSAFEQEAMREQVRDVPQTRLHQILDALFREETVVKFSSQPRLAVEMAFFRVVRLEPAVSIDTLIEKMDLLQKGVVSVTQEGGSASPPAVEPLALSPRTDPSPENSRPGYVAPALGPDMPKEIKESPPAAPFTVEEARPALSPPEDEPADISWKNILDILFKSHDYLKPCFAVSSLRKTEGGALEIHFTAKQINVNLAKKPASMSALQAACDRYFGKPMILSLRPSVQESRAPRIKQQDVRLLEAEAMAHPLVRETLRLFNGKVVDIIPLQTAIGDET